MRLTIDLIDYANIQFQISPLQNQQEKLQLTNWSGDERKNKALPPAHVDSSKLLLRFIKL